MSDRGAVGSAVETALLLQAEPWLHKFKAVSSRCVARESTWEAGRGLGTCGVFKGR